MHVQVSLQYAYLEPLGHIPRVVQLSFMVGSSIFCFLRNLHTDFHNGRTNLHTHQQWVRIIFPFIFVSSLKKHFNLCVCEHVCMPPMCVPRGQKEMSIPWSWSYRHLVLGATWCGYLESISGPLEEE